MVVAASWCPFWLAAFALLYLEGERNAISKTPRWSGSASCSRMEDKDDGVGPISSLTHEGHLNYHLASMDALGLSQKALEGTQHGEYTILMHRCIQKERFLHPRP